MSSRTARALGGLIIGMLVTSGCATPTLSKVAYIISEGPGATSVLVQNAEGGRPVRVSGLSGSISDIVVSPNGQRLAYVTGGTTTGLEQVLVVDLDDNNNIVGARRNFSDELPTARSFSPKFLDDDHLLYLSETGGERVLVLVDLRTGGKQKISPVSGSIDTVARYDIEGKYALFFGFNKEMRRYDLPTGPLRMVVASTGSISGQAYEKMGIFENTLVFSVQATPKERAFTHMRLDGTGLKSVLEASQELVFPIIKLARDPGSRVQRFNLFDFTLVTWPEERMITLEGYEVTSQKIVERHLFWVVRGLSNPDKVYAVYEAQGLEALRTGTYTGSVYLASTGSLLVWYNPVNKKIWGVPLDNLGAAPTDLSAGVIRVANRPFSVSSQYIGVVTEEGKLYLLSTSRKTPPILLGQGAQVSLTR
ncbi:MAG: TolB family protein [Candidatus Methylomirabilis sp.]